MNPWSGAMQSMPWLQACDPLVFVHMYISSDMHTDARAPRAEGLQGGQERGRSERSREDRGRSARLGGIGENEACGGNAGIRIMWKSTGFSFARSSAPIFDLEKRGCVVIYHKFKF